MDTDINTTEYVNLLYATYSHLQREDLYLAGISANLHLGYDVYALSNDLYFHQDSPPDAARRGTRVTGLRQNVDTAYRVHTSTYRLPPHCFEKTHFKRTLSPAALIVDHLRNSDLMTAICNAEAVIRGYLRPQRNIQVFINHVERNFKLNVLRN